MTLAAQGARLILASASPRRRELLESLEIKFSVVVAQITEAEDPTMDPRRMVQHNAALKAGWVAQQNPEAFVLGADTTVFLGGKVFNKPRDLADARAMLTELAGRTHTVFTGLALHYPSGNVVEATTSSEVTFRDFGDETITEYFRKINPLDKAGAYSIQEERELVVAKWEGSLTNIMGLPVDTTKQILTDAGLLG